MIRVASCFAQVLSLVNDNDFQRAMRRHGAEKGAKGFSCWGQFVSMLLCQMGAANSLREICGGLATAMGKLVHLGMRKAPARSTLSHANTHRLTGVQAEKRCPHLPVESHSALSSWPKGSWPKGLWSERLRRIVVWDVENDREITLLTNIFHLAASTVAAIYKERWQIELFFKALKQNLKVKTFVGTSENAVKTQKCCLSQPITKRLRTG